MEPLKKRQPAGRAVPRPTRIEPCPQCRAVLGLNYLDCASCHQAIERFWETDWRALLAHEQIVAESADESLLAQVVIAELDDHLWTVVDMAMRRVRCVECGSELGGGPIDCAECKFAFGNLWWHDIDAAQQGAMTMDEHALRVGRYVIRHPHRYSYAIATGWRMNMPRILTGWLPPGQEARHYATLLKSGQTIDWEAIYQQIDAEINRASDAKRS